MLRLCVCVCFGVHTSVHLARHTFLILCASGFSADSVGLGVSRMDILFLLFDHSSFLMIFWCLSGHFWLVHKVQQTSNGLAANPHPNGQNQWNSNEHSQWKSNRIPMVMANRSLMDCKQVRLVIDIINEKGQ